SVQPGGLLGAVVAQGLASGLNTIGATVVLIAIAATGLLLATNISFIRLYSVIAEVISTRFAFVSVLPDRFKTWRANRREQARLKKETKAAIKAERDANRGQLKQTLNLTPAERVADFMKETAPTTTPATQVIRSDIETTEPAPSVPVQALGAGAGVGAGAGAGAGAGGVGRATIVTGRSG